MPKKVKLSTRYGPSDEMTMDQKKRIAREMNAEALTRRSRGVPEGGRIGMFSNKNDLLGMNRRAVKSARERHPLVGTVGKGGGVELHGADRVRGVEVKARRKRGK